MQLTEYFINEINTYQEKLGKIKKLTAGEKADFDLVKTSKHGEKMSVKVENVFQRLFQSVKCCIINGELHLVLDTKNKTVIETYLNKNKIVYEISKTKDWDCLIVKDEEDKLFLIRHEINKLCSTFYN